MDNGFESNNNGETATAPPTNGHAVNGNGTSTESSNTVVLDYSAEFPSLTKTAPVNTGAWVPRSAPSRAVNVSQMLTFAADERMRAGGARAFGGSTSEEQDRCNTISKDTDTKIELCEAKDGSLTIFISGRRKNVEDARSALIRDLQMQNQVELTVPKSHHRIIIGKDGGRLKDLEKETNCRIVMPGRDADTDVIKISGPRDGLKLAVQKIREISDTQSKLATEHLLIPRRFYPWIRGPLNETIDSLSETTGAKINIPPSAAKNEVIVVAGEKEGVAQAVAKIRAIYEQQQRFDKSFTMKVNRAQHRLIVGQQRRGIAEILRDTGISVEVPDVEENSDEITLRGDPSKFATAAAIVLTRAASVITTTVPAPTWLHKWLIGPKGATLQNLVPNRGRLQIDFDDAGSIFIEGPPEEVKAAQATLLAEVAKLEATMAIEKVKAHPSFHRHVIGKGGSLISKLKDEAGVQITIPNEATHSDEIIVEGNKEGVKKAVKQIRDLVQKMENEKQRDLIVEQRFHKLLIGAKGENIGKLRTSYPSVSIVFPDAKASSSIISLRGDRAEVDRVAETLTKQVKELAESNYQATVPIFREFRKHVIGKGGATIRRIRDETQTRIDMPSAESSEDVITVTGKKANVDKAIAELNKIQNELSNIVTENVTVPLSVQARLTGGGRRLLLDIQDQCGGVHIKFPAEKEKSEKCTIRGPKEDALKAKKQLEQLVADKDQLLHEETLIAKPEFHRFIVGRSGQRINQLRERYPDARVILPSNKPNADAKEKEPREGADVIHILGRKEHVEAVKKELSELVKQLNEQAEIKTTIPQKHHRHFLSRNAALLKEISEQFGGVNISFPGKGEETDVVIKGVKQCAEGAKNRLHEIVADLESQVTIEVEIPREHHGALLANRAAKIQTIQDEHSVHIRFPERRQPGAEAAAPAAETAEAAAPSPSLIRISGRDTNCDAAKAALLALVPIQQTVAVRAELRGSLIGKAGAVVREIMQAHDVNVDIPKSGDADVTVTGVAANVAAAIQDIESRIGEFEKDAEDKKLRSYQLQFELPAEFHQRLIGTRGAVVNELRRKHDVQISFPREGEPADQITITGYEASAAACRSEMESFVADARSLYTEKVNLDPRYQRKLIGPAGKNIKKVMEKYGVEIRTPRPSDPEPGMVTVAGKSEDAVWDCIEYLRTDEEAIMADYHDRNAHIARREQPAPAPVAPVQVQIAGIGWKMSDSDFPSMGNSSSAPVAASTGAWGRPR